MAEASQSTCSQSLLYRSNHFNNRYNHHSEHVQHNSTSRRSTFTSGMNRRHNSFAQHSHSRSVPEVVRETGLVLEVQREYGRILSQSSFSAPNIHIYFSLSTLVNDAPLSTITDNLADVFQVGSAVEIEVEGSVDPRNIRDRVHVILTCSSIKPSAENGQEPELVPMIVIQDAGEVPLALIANHELVALPRQVFPLEEIASAFIAKKNEVTTDMEWPEFATIGRSIEGRILNAPPWMHEFTNPAIKKIALSLQRFGRDREGFAIIKEYVGQGVVLMPIDEEDKRTCGDLFFPFEMRTDRLCTNTECEDTYRLGSKWYFRACLELPNRKYKYRVYRLDSLEDGAVIVGDSSVQEHFPEQTANSSACTNEVPLTATKRVTEPIASAGPPADESVRLIELDDSKSVQVPSSARTVHNTAVAISPVTLNLLSTVNFDTSPITTAVHGVGETLLLQSSPHPTCSDSTDDPLRTNLLGDFGIANKLQQVRTEVRQFHVLDENFALSSFNFDFKEARKGSYEAEMCGCSDHESGEDIFIKPQRTNLQSGNAETSQVLDGANPLEGQPMNLGRSAIPTGPSKAIKHKDDNLMLRTGRCLVEEQVCSGGILPTVDQEIDTSDDDSDNEEFHAVPVKRLDNNGWWFTRKIPNEMDEKKASDEVSSAVPCCSAGNSGECEPKSALENDKPLLILTDDGTESVGTASLTTTPQPSLSTALQNDNVYAKFFSGLLQK